MRVPSIALLLAALVPSVAHAAGGSAGEAAYTDWWSLIKHALNLAILAFILVRFALPALREFFRSRADQVRSEIETAQARLAAAEAELGELRGRLDGFQAEADGIIAASTEAAEGERVRVIERAHAQAERIRDDARRVAESEVARARQALRDEAARLAVDLAAGILRDSATEDDDRRIVQEFTESLSQTGART